MGERALYRGTFRLGAGRDVRRQGHYLTSAPPDHMQCLGCPLRLVAAHARLVSS
jgi:hypothetical protein